MRRLSKLVSMVICIALLSALTAPAVMAEPEENAAPTAEQSAEPVPEETTVPEEKAAAPEETAVPEETTVSEEPADPEEDGEPEALGEALPEEEEPIIDDMTDFSKSSEHTENLESFGTHAETGLSVVGRKDAESDSSITYDAPEGKYIADTAVNIQYVPDFTNFENDLKVYVLTEDGTEWIEVPITIGDVQDIPGCETSQFKTNSLSIELPDKVLKVRVTLGNDIPWTLMLNEVSMNVRGGEVPAGTDSVVTDDLTDFSKTTEHTDNLESFGSHADTGLSVIGRKDAESDSSLVYSAPEGQYISGSTVNIQYAPDFTNFSKDLKVYVMTEDGTDWVEVTISLGEAEDIPGYDGGVFKTNSLSLELPENVLKMKITLDNDIAWTMFLNQITMNMTGALPEEPEEECDVITDDLTDFSKTTEHTDNLESFDSHAESGLSVIGRKDTTSESSITYTAPDGKYFVNAAVNIQYVPAFTSFPRDLKVYVLPEGETEWVLVSLKAGANENIPGFETGAFKTCTLSPEFTGNIVKMRICLENDVAWTLFLNEISLGVADNGAEAPVRPYIPVNLEGLVDELTSFALTSEHTQNFEIFNHHVETGLSVIGRKDAASESSITYSAPAGRYITGASLLVQYVPDYFNPDGDLAVYVMTEGSEEWTAVKIAMGGQKDILGYETSVFKSLGITAELPNKVVKIRFALQNEVAWTLFFDRVELVYSEA